MKILLAGTPGIRKSTAFRNLQKAASTLGQDQRLFTPRVDDDTEGVPILERYLYGEAPIPFLELSTAEQRRRWSIAFDQVLRDFDGARNDHHVLGMHFILRYKRIPSCIVDFTKLVQWKPDCIVTLVDDAYETRARIHAGGYPSFTLQELVMWRSEELLAGDVLASLLGCQNYLVAIKHPADMLARLLFGSPRVARPYLSYQITEIRNDAEKRAIIDQFRMKMHRQRNCAVFDPLTIDELPPLIHVASRRQSGRTLRYDPAKPKHRWLVSNHASSLAGERDLRFPLTVPCRELADAQEAIDAQVRHRDIRLVDQASHLIVYRPTISGTKQLSSGVQGEVSHASYSQRPIIWYIKKGEDKLPASPFTPKNPGDNPDFIYEPTERRFWQRISRLAPPPTSSRVPVSIPTVDVAVAAH